MTDDFHEIFPFQMPGNPFLLLDHDWMLITAGNKDHYNTMTASWGGFGILWHKAVCFVFVRPTRYTYEFMEAYPSFTLSFFELAYKKALNHIGSVSGRDRDKISESGLTPMETAEGRMSFGEARMIIECRKRYAEDIKPSHFLDPEIERNYPAKDYHRIYIGEIVHIWEKNK